MKSFVAPLLAASTFALKVKQLNAINTAYASTPDTYDDAWAQATYYDSGYYSEDITSQDFTYGQTDY